MIRLGYFIAKIKSKLFKSDKHIVNYLKRGGITIGSHCHIYSNIMTSESYLISIGDNVTISSDVVFVTHDNSIIKLNPNTSNLFGLIKIGNNCFLGQRSTIMYGVTLADNIIVASGSVVANSFLEERIIIGGNPAKKIGTWDLFMEKYQGYGMSPQEARNNYLTRPELFVKRKVK